MAPGRNGVGVGPPFAGPSSPRVDRPSRRIARTLPVDIQEVLDEIDELARQLGLLVAAQREAPFEAEPPPDAIWQEEPTGPPPPPSPSSPYLEERLARAGAVLASLRAKCGGMAETWQHLDGAVRALELELGNAAHELQFLRTAEPVSAPAPRARPITTPVARSLPLPVAAPPYADFTIRRYNATVGSLKARRSGLLLGTVLLAAVISAVLVGVQLLAREPMPSVWLGLLPLVWMIPVPFFLLSFFGTQRVLRRNHLDLAEGP